MEWWQWPIRDYGVPDAAFETAWPERSARLRSLLACGGRVLIHCKGGLGRAGTVSVRLLVENGMAPGQAINAMRAARPGAIEIDHLGRVCGRLCVVVAGALAHSKLANVFE